MEKNMTILIEQPDHVSQFEEKNVYSKETNELVLNGTFPLPKHVSQNGFMAPKINSFGHSFRNYDAESERQKGVKEFYRWQHINQTYDFILWCYAASVQKKMTILVKQPELVSQFEEKNVHSEETNELVLGGGFPLPKHVSQNGFMAPEINSFGHSFRNYDAESERQKGVEKFYRLQHINQTYDFVKRVREGYKKLDKAEMGIWECCELLNEVVDDSDPDLDEPQIQYLLQSAEVIRKDYPDEHWLHLTALIHDLGKILLLPSFGELPQWAVIGDTFPLGCAFDESNVHHKYFKDNPDYQNPNYNTKNGIYTEGCGLNNVVMSFGHDDYMYLVAKENGTTLPPAALFIIRYRSFYPLHKEGAYTHLMNEEDVENSKWLKIFNKYDLYRKSKVQVDVENVKPYYLSLIEKYFPAKLKW